MSSGVLKGRDVLVGLIVFFALVFAVDGAFVYLALKSHPGDEAKDAYAGGLAYNRRLAEKQQQDGLGWQADLSLEPAPFGQLIDLRILDAQGRPVSGLQITAQLHHPAKAVLDRSMEFSPTQPGHYCAQYREPRSAQWDLVIEARSDRGEVFRMRHRL